MGALTSKPFTFTARSWELVSRLAHDCTDTFFSALKVSFRGAIIMRILPDFSQTVLSEWISDRIRFSYDAVQTESASDLLFGISYSSLSASYLHFFSKRFSLNQYFSDFVSCSQVRGLTSFCGSAVPNYSKLSSYCFDGRKSYSFEYSNFFDSSSFKTYFLVGVNFRYQLPVFSVSLRKLVNSPDSFCFNFGFFTNNLFNEVNFGHSLSSLFSTIRAKSRISRLFFSSKTVVFTNPFFYPVISANSGLVSVHSFFDTPKDLVIAEIFSNFSAQPYSTQIELFTPHFFKLSLVYPKLNRLQKFISPINLQSISYRFYFFSKNFANFDLPYFFNRVKFDKSFFCYDNFYTHYSNYSNSFNSLNVLLALKRQSDSRANFIYYT